MLYIYDEFGALCHTCTELAEVKEFLNPIAGIDLEDNIDLGGYFVYLDSTKLEPEQIFTPKDFYSNREWKQIVKQSN